MVWFSTQILLVTSRVLVAGFAGCADVLRGLHSHSPSSSSPSGGRAVGMLHAASLVAGAREGGRVRESSSGCQFRTAMLVTLLPVTHLVLTPQLMLTLRSQSC